MFTVRATKKLLDRVGRPVADPPSSSTVFGDWYANVLFWRRQVALFVNATTFVPVLMPLAPASGVVARFPTAMAEVFQALGIDRGFVASETDGTSSRSWPSTRSAPAPPCVSDQTIRSRRCPVHSKRILSGARGCVGSGAGDRSRWSVSGVPPDGVARRSMRPHMEAAPASPQRANPGGSSDAGENAGITFLAYWLGQHQVSRGRYTREAELPAAAKEHPAVLLDGPGQYTQVDEYARWLLNRVDYLAHRGREGRTSGNDLAGCDDRRIIDTHRGTSTPDRFRPRCSDQPECRHGSSLLLSPA